jgi:serine protease AprX
MRRMLLAGGVVGAAAVALSILGFPASGAGSAAWQGKVDPWVLARGRAGGATEFLVVLGEQADLSAVARLGSKEAKGRFVVARLREVAARTQPPVLAALAARGVESRPYWIRNLIWVRGDLGTVEAMAARPDVARIAANPEVALEEPAAAPATPEARAPLAIEPGISHVGAPDLWAAGYTGQGAVVAGADTGVQWDHAALLGHYRGWNGATADHNYNWHDAIHSGSGGVCGLDSTEPCDDSGHGSHTVGTMVGDDGGANQIGMAPGAKWIACRNMDQGAGTPARYLECFQFFLAPTDLSDQNPNPALAPDVINNSWSCPTSEGCTDPAVLQAAVDNARAAGIAVVVSAGNGGSGCSTINTPAAIYDSSITVGATNTSDAITSFSSRGPVLVDGSNRLKPDLVAPGLSVRSSVPPGTYAFYSGTSMSGPHVAGLAALLISAAPCLKGDVDALEAYMIATAVPLTSSQGCGGYGPAAVPNPTYGWGAIRAVLPTAAACSAVFADGFESGDTSAWSAAVP